MKRILSVIVILVTLLSMVTTLSAMAANDAPKAVSSAMVELYSDSNGRLFANENGAKAKVLTAGKEAGTITVAKLSGVSNGLITDQATHDALKGILTANGNIEYLYLSSYVFKKVEIADGYAKLPKDVKGLVEGYENFWPRALMRLTLEVHGTAVGHRAEVYNKSKHLLVAKYYFGNGKSQWLGVYLNKDGELVLCLAPKGENPGKPTPTPKPKPTKTPATPTPKPPVTPTPKPPVTPKPTATPVVTAKPPRPADNGDGGYGENPLTKTTVRPVATPKVTARPVQPMDNQDGGYGENPLKKKTNSGGSTTPKPTPKPTPKATPKAEPEGEKPL